MGGSLYERLGGKAAITVVIDDFVARCAADARINGKFARTDIARLQANLVDQVCAATGGPCEYAGRDARIFASASGVRQIVAAKVNDCRGNCA